MIRLTLNYARHDPRDLIGQIIVAFAAGFSVIMISAVCLTMVFQQFVESGEPSGLVLAGASSAFGTLVSYMLIGLFTIGTTVSKLTVAANYQRYAQWLSIGMPASAVRAGIRARALLTAIAGVVLAIPLAVVFDRPIDSSFRTLVQVPGTPGLLSATLGVVSGIVVAAGLVIAVTVISSLRPSTKAANTAPADMLRQNSLAVPRRTAGGIVGRLLWVAALLALVVPLAVVVPEDEIEPPEIVAAVAASGLFTVIAMAVLLPLVARPVVRALTSIVPDSASASWFVARRAAIERAGVTTTAITAVTLSAGMVLMFQSINDITTMFSPGATLPSGQWDNFFWGMGPLMLMSLAGGCATLLIGAQQREGDLRVMRGLGFGRGAVIRSALIEPVIFTLTGTVLAIVAVTASIVIAIARGQALGLIFTPAIPNLVPIAIVVGSMLVALTLANLWPVTSSLKRLR